MAVVPLPASQSRLFQDSLVESADFRGCQSYCRKGIGDFFLANRIFGKALATPVTFNETCEFPPYTRD
jgi:hypothetical protein